MSSPSRPSPDPYPGLAGLPDGLMREVVDAVWFESGRMRASLHRLRRVRACDVVVRVAGCGSLFVGGECPCRDFVLDMLVEADRFLARHEPSGLRNPPGAVRAHVRRRAQEWTRRRRADAGAQARTDRLDASEQGRRLPDAYHRALLRNLADEAGSLALLGDERGLLQRLAALAANQFGGEVADHLGRVVAALPLVEEACRAGRRVPARDGSGPVTWWERYIEEPLGRRDRIDTQPLDELDDVESAMPDGGCDELVLGIVVRAVSGPGRSGVAARLHGAVAELVRLQLMSAGAAGLFTADPARVRAAAEQAWVLASA
ncbi:hypothetical protein [Pseudonocardia sp. 73-21]|uniref:hypothetical protein n=1 Tax=Pseudonocardia sp. 73-21 TaxID=1895809 RepID=UPI00262BFBE9|nr:hypothetical protein [Pseudonocardia sp. 73-21]